VFETDDGRKIDVPEGLTPEEERAVLMALERYFVAENPKPAPSPAPNPPPTRCRRRWRCTAPASTSSPCNAT